MVPSQEKPFKTSFKKPLRVISLIVLAAFLMQEAASAQGGTPSWATYAKSSREGFLKDSKDLAISIPRELGISRDAHFGEGPDTIIQIQDAHDSLSAQTRIAEILETLVQDYDLRLVALEGSVGEIDASVLRTFPEKNIRDAFAHTLLREGGLNAGEFFSVISKEPVKVMGIEDPELYSEDVGHFETLLDHKKSLKRQLNRLIDLEEEIREKVYPDEVRYLLSNGILGQNGDVKLTEKWDALREVARKHDISVEPYANLEKLIEVRELERSIDFRAADEEREALLRLLNSTLHKNELQTLVLRNLAFKSRKISEGQYHLFLSDLAAQHHIPVSGFANIARYTEYQLLFENINLASLFDEVAEFEKKVIDKLLATEDEKLALSLCQRIRILVDLVSGTLTSGKFQEFLKNRGDFSFKKFDRLASKLSESHGVRYYQKDDLEDVFKDLDKALRFYESARKRDEAIVRNTLKRMGNEGVNVTALVTGGFHTGGVSELIRDKKLSYLVVMPKIEEKDEKRPYIAILTKRGEDEFEGLKNQYDIAFGTVFDTALQGSFYGDELKKRQIETYITRLLVQYAFDIPVGVVRDAEDAKSAVRSIKERWMDDYRIHGRELALSRSEFEDLLRRLPDELFEPVLLRRTNAVSIGLHNRVYRFLKQDGEVEMRVIRAQPELLKAAEAPVEAASEALRSEIIEESKARYLELLKSSETPELLMRNWRNDWLSFVDRRLRSKGILESDPDEIELATADISQQIEEIRRELLAASAVPEVVGGEPDVAAEGQVGVAEARRAPTDDEAIVPASGITAPSGARVIRWRKRDVQVIRDFVRETPGPKVILIDGRPDSGKTALFRQMREDTAVDFGFTNRDRRYFDQGAGLALLFNGLAKEGIDPLGVSERYPLPHRLLKQDYEQYGQEDLSGFGTFEAGYFLTFLYRHRDELFSDANSNTLVMDDFGSSDWTFEEVQWANFLDTFDLPIEIPEEFLDVHVLKAEIKTWSLLGLRTFRRISFEETTLREERDRFLESGSRLARRRFRRNFGWGARDVLDYVAGTRDLRSITHYPDPVPVIEPIDVPYAEGIQRANYRHSVSVAGGEPIEFYTKRFERIDSRERARDVQGILETEAGIAQIAHSLDVGERARFFKRSRTLVRLPVQGQSLQQMGLIHPDIRWATAVAYSLGRLHTRTYHGDLVEKGGVRADHIYLEPRPDGSFYARFIDFHRRTYEGLADPQEAERKAVYEAFYTLYLHTEFQSQVHRLFSEAYEKGRQSMEGPVGARVGPPAELERDLMQPSGSRLIRLLGDVIFSPRFIRFITAIAFVPLLGFVAFFALGYETPAFFLMNVSMVTGGLMIGTYVVFCVAAALSLGARYLSDAVRAGHEGIKRLRSRFFGPKKAPYSPDQITEDVRFTFSQEGIDIPFETVSALQEAFFRLGYRWDGAVINIAGLEGHGSNADLFSARDVQTGEHVVVKTDPYWRNPGADPDIPRSAYTERMSFASWNWRESGTQRFLASQPHFVQLRDYGELKVETYQTQKILHYQILEDVAGQGLNAHLSSPGLEPLAVLGQLIELLETIRRMYSKGFHYSDPLQVISPQGTELLDFNLQNVLVEPQGRFRVVDLDRFHRLSWIDRFILNRSTTAIGRRVLKVIFPPATNVEFTFLRDRMNLSARGFVYLVSEILTNLEFDSEMENRLRSDLAEYVDLADKVRSPRQAVQLTDHMLESLSEVRDQRQVQAEGARLAYEPWLPSRSGLLEIARKDNQVVFEEVRAFSVTRSPLVEALSRTFQAFYRYLDEGNIGGIHFGALVLDEMAKKREIPLGELRKELQLPDWARGFLVTFADTGSKSTPQQRLMEEVFHALENVEINTDWKHHKDILEIVDDVLQLMFYPRNRVEFFYSEYTNWTTQGRLALLDHYRYKPGRNPNTEMVRIIEALRDDVGRTGEEPAPIIDLIVPTDLAYRDERIQTLRLHLDLLLKNQRFSRHEILFPDWTPVEEVPESGARLALPHDVDPTPIPGRSVGGPLMYPHVPELAITEDYYKRESGRFVVDREAIIVGKDYGYGRGPQSFKVATTSVDEEAAEEVAGPEEAGGLAVAQRVGRRIRYPDHVLQVYGPDEKWLGLDFVPLEVGNMVTVRRGRMPPIQREDSPKGTGRLQYDRKTTAKYVDPRDPEGKRVLRAYVDMEPEPQPPGAKVKKEPVPRVYVDMDDSRLLENMEEDPPIPEDEMSDWRIFVSFTDPDTKAETTVLLPESYRSQAVSRRYRPDLPATMAIAEGLRSEPRPLARQVDKEYYDEHVDDGDLDIPASVGPRGVKYRHRNEDGSYSYYILYPNGRMDDAFGIERLNQYQYDVTTFGALYPVDIYQVKEEAVGEPVIDIDEESLVTDRGFVTGGEREMALRQIADEGGEVELNNDDRVRIPIEFGRPFEIRVRDGAPEVFTINPNPAHEEETIVFYWDGSEWIGVARTVPGQEEPVAGQADASLASVYIIFAHEGGVDVRTYVSGITVRVLPEDEARDRGLMGARAAAGRFSRFLDKVLTAFESPWVARPIWTVMFVMGIVSAFYVPAIVVPYLLVVLPIGAAIILLTGFASMFRGKYLAQLGIMSAGMATLIYFSFDAIHSFGGASNIYSLAADLTLRFLTVFSGVLISKILLPSEAEEEQSYLKRGFDTFKWAVVLSLVSGFFLYSVHWPMMAFYFGTSFVDSVFRTFFDMGLPVTFLILPISVLLGAAFGEDKDVTDRGSFRQAVSFFFRGDFSAFRREVLEVKGIRTLIRLTPLNYVVWVPIIFLGWFASPYVVSLAGSLGIQISPGEALNYIHAAIALGWTGIIQKTVDRHFNVPPDQVADETESVEGARVTPTELDQAIRWLESQETYVSLTLNSSVKNFVRIWGRLLIPPTPDELMAALRDQGELFIEEELDSNKYDLRDDFKWLVGDIHKRLSRDDLQRNLEAVEVVLNARYDSVLERSRQLMRAWKEQGSSAEDVLINMRHDLRGRLAQYVLQTKARLADGGEFELREVMRDISDNVGEEPWHENRTGFRLFPAIGESVAAMLDRHLYDHGIDIGDYYRRGSILRVLSGIESTDARLDTERLRLALNGFVNEFMEALSGERIRYEARVGPINPSLTNELMAVHRVVNPSGGPMVAVYAGSGIDVSSYLWALDARRGYFVLGEYLSKRGLMELNTMIQDPSEDDRIYEYVSQKWRAGMTATLKLQGKELVRALAYEFRSMGIQEVLVDEEDGHPRIQFTWTYPGGVPQSYQITFINAGITKVDSYPRLLRKVIRSGIDALLTKAGFNIAGAYRTSPFIRFIYDHMPKRRRAFFVTDDHWAKRVEQSGEEEDLGTIRHTYVDGADDFPIANLPLLNAEQVALNLSRMPTPTERYGRVLRVRGVDKTQGARLSWRRVRAALVKARGRWEDAALILGLEKPEGGHRAGLLAAIVDDLGKYEDAMKLSRELRAEDRAKKAEEPPEGARVWRRLELPWGRVMIRNNFDPVSSIMSGSGLTDLYTSFSWITLSGRGLDQDRLVALLRFLHEGIEAPPINEPVTMNFLEGSIYRAMRGSVDEDIVELGQFLSRTGFPSHIFENLIALINLVWFHEAKPTVRRRGAERGALIEHLGEAFISTEYWIGRDEFPLVSEVRRERRERFSEGFGNLGERFRFRVIKRESQREGITPTWIRFAMVNTAGGFVRDPNMPPFEIWINRPLRETPTDTASQVVASFEDLRYAAGIGKKSTYSNYRAFVTESLAEALNQPPAHLHPARDAKTRDEMKEEVPQWPPAGARVSAELHALASRLRQLRRMLPSVVADISGDVGDAVRLAEGRLRRAASLTRRDPDGTVHYLSEATRILRERVTEKYAARGEIIMREIARAAADIGEFIFVFKLHLDSDEGLSAHVKKPHQAEVLARMGEARKAVQSIVEKYGLHRTGRLRHLLELLEYHPDLNRLDFSSHFNLINGLPLAHKFGIHDLGELFEYRFFWIDEYYYQYIRRELLQEIERRLSRIDAKERAAVVAELEEALAGVSDALSDFGHEIVEDMESNGLWSRLRHAQVAKVALEAALETLGRVEDETVSGMLEELKEARWLTQEITRQILLPASQIPPDASDIGDLAQRADGILRNRILANLGQVSSDFARNKARDALLNARAALTPLAASGARAAISPILGDVIREDVYLAHEALFWIQDLARYLDAQQMRGRRLTSIPAQEIRDFFHRWSQHEGPRIFAAVVRGGQGAQPLLRVLEMCEVQWGDALPYVDWFRRHRDLVTAQMPVIFAGGNLVVDRNQAFAYRHPDAQRFLIGHEAFHEEFDGLPDAERQAIEERLSAGDARPIADRLMRSYQYQPGTREYLKELAAQSIYSSRLVSNGWGMDESGGLIPLDFRELDPETSELIQWRWRLFSEFPALREANQRAVGRVNAVVDRIDRLARAMGRMEALREARQGALRSAFEQALVHLKAIEINADNIRGSLSSRREAIFDRMNELHEVEVGIAVLKGDVERYMELTDTASPDCGIRSAVNDAFFDALENTSEDLARRLARRHLYATRRGIRTRVHTYPVISPAVGKVGDAGTLAVDAAVGEYIPEYIRQLVVMDFSEYDAMIRGAVARSESPENRQRFERRLRRGREMFEAVREKMVERLLAEEPAPEPPEGARLNTLSKAIRFYSGIFRLRDLANFFEPALVWNALRWYKADPQTGRYQPRRLRTHNLTITHRLEGAEREIARQGREEFERFMDRIAEVFPRRKGRIQVDWIPLSRAHLTITNLRYSKEVLRDPARYVRLSPSQVRRMNANLSEIDVPAPLVELVGFWVTPDSALIALFYDRNSRMTPLREAIREKAGEFIPDVEMRDVIHVTLGRILDLPFSEDPVVRKEEMKKVRQIARQFARGLRDRWGTYGNEVLIDRLVLIAESVALETEYETMVDVALPVEGREVEGARVSPRIIVGVPDESLVQEAEKLAADLKGVEVVPLDSADLESMTSALEFMVELRGAVAGFLYDEGLGTQEDKLAFVRLVADLDEKVLRLNPLFHMLLSGRRGIQDYSEDELHDMAQRIIPYLPKPAPKKIVAGVGIVPKHRDLAQETGTESFPVHYASALREALAAYLEEGTIDDLSSLAQVADYAYGASANEEDVLKLVEEAIRAQEDVVEELRLQLYHPSFRYQFKPETVSQIQSPKAVIWTFEMLKDPFFFQMLDDRDRKLGTDYIADYVLMTPLGEEQLRAELGDEGYEAFVRRFGPDQIIGLSQFEEPSGIAPIDVFPFLPVEKYNYDLEDVIFVDKLESSLIMKPQDDPTPFVLIKLDGVPLALDKVIVELLAMEGDIQPLPGLKPIEGVNVFIFRSPAPIDFQYQFRKYYQMREMIRAAA